MPLRRKAAAVELRKSLPVLAGAIIVLLLASLKISATSHKAQNVQRTIRLAQADRSGLLRVQLDEETGVRGYSGTEEAFFLQPFYQASPRMKPLYESLNGRLVNLGLVRLQAAAAAEQRLNRKWLTFVAQPLRNHPGMSAEDLTLQRRGKDLVDAFRRYDRELFIGLDEAANDADARASRVLDAELAFVALLLALLCASALAVFYTRIAKGNQQLIADLFQTALLNRALPKVRGIAFHAVYKPATKHALVGGDWYDVFQLPDQRILFSVGDVAGHGLVAAVNMNRARQAIVASAPFEVDPACVLARANASILLQEPCMVTAVCGFIEPETFAVAYATAGHPSPIVCASGIGSTVLPHAGIPLGIFPDVTYGVFHTVIPDGGLLVLYTDGVIEHGRDIVAGEQRLLDASRSAIGQTDPARALQHAIFGSQSPVDDIAILAISFDRKRHERTVSLPVSALRFDGVDRKLGPTEAPT